MDASSCSMEKCTARSRRRRAVTLGSATTPCSSSPATAARWPSSRRMRSTASRIAGSQARSCERALPAARRRWGLSVLLALRRILRGFLVVLFFILGGFLFGLRVRATARGERLGVRTALRFALRLLQMRAVRDRRSGQRRPEGGGLIGRDFLAGLRVDVVRDRTKRVADRVLARADLSLRRLDLAQEVALRARFEIPAADDRGEA